MSCGVQTTLTKDQSQHVQTTSTCIGMADEEVQTQELGYMPSSIHSMTGMLLLQL